MPTAAPHAAVLAEDMSPEVVAAELRDAWRLEVVQARCGRPRQPPYTDAELALAWTVGWDHAMAP